MNTTDAIRPADSERPAHSAPGTVGLVATLGLLAAAVLCYLIGVRAAIDSDPVAIAWLAAGVLLTAACLAAACGLLVVQPNQASVVIVLGRYAGTVRDPGWHWVNPLSVVERKPVSLRLRTFTTPVAKVNDSGGNPVEIAAVVIWRVVDTARAVFEVDHYDEYVRQQSETSLRYIATEYPYDDHQADGLSLRGNPVEVAASLSRELQGRLREAGMEVVETRLSHLAYAPEIAEAMLRRQQASAVVAARRIIVDGAVGMVEDALDMLRDRAVVELDEERKATMVSNLLVVLTSDHQIQPVVNAGSIY